MSAELKRQRKYPCVPTPFETMFGAVMICRKCGHYPPKECSNVQG